MEAFRLELAANGDMIGRVIKKIGINNSSMKRAGRAILPRRNHVTRKTTISYDQGGWMGFTFPTKALVLPRTFPANPHIVRIVDYSPMISTYLVAMIYIDGKPEYMIFLGPVGHWGALNYARQSAEGSDAST